MSETKTGWTLLSSHGLVLFHVAAHPDHTLRQMSDVLGITERQVARIVKDLAEAGLLRIERRGRRNYYTVNSKSRLWDPALSQIELSRILEAVVPASGAAPSTAQPTADTRSA